MLDARRMEWSEIAVQRDPECGVCRSRHQHPSPSHLTQGQ
jgi:hypothetical protein